MEWAINRYKEDAAVIGAVIDLGHCLNLTDSSSSEILQQGYEQLKAFCLAAGISVPKNSAPNKDSDVLLRNLDCAVIQQIHDYNKQSGNREYDSVRGIFEEGGEAYPGSAFKERTHVQLCIRNPNCIKGYFRPLSQNKDFIVP